MDCVTLTSTVKKLCEWRLSSSLIRPVSSGGSLPPWPIGSIGLIKQKQQGSSSDPITKKTMLELRCLKGNGEIGFPNSVSQRKINTQLKSKITSCRLSANSAYVRLIGRALKNG